MSDSIKKTNPIKQAFIDSLEIPHLRIIAPIVFILVCALIYPLNYKICGFDGHLIPLSYYSIAIIFYSFMVFFLTAENKINFLTEEFPDFIFNCLILLAKIFLYLAIASAISWIVVFLVIIGVITFILFKDFITDKLINKLCDLCLGWIFKEGEEILFEKIKSFFK